MHHFVKVIAVAATMGLMSAPAWACHQHGQNTQGSQHLQAADDIVGPALAGAADVQPVRLLARRGYFRGPAYSHSYYHGPYDRFGRRYDFDRRPWAGYYRPYYRGGVAVGPVGVWW